MTEELDGPSQAAPFKDAEAWLAARGVTREPISVEAGEGQHPDPAPSAPITPRDVRRLAVQADADTRLRNGGTDSLPDPGARGLDPGARGLDPGARGLDPGARGLEDEVARAMAFVRSSTAAAPQSEGRVRQKLTDRDIPSTVIEAALERARRERLVDDHALAAALIAERRARGHAVARIRRDLRNRGFVDDVLETALGALASEDEEAAAFAVARDKAAGLTGVTAETAFRRVAGHVARRGYPESLARKVAREAVFTARDAERAAGH